MLSNEFVRGSLRPVILKLLQDTGRMYGYEITCRMRQLSGGRILLSEGAIYPVLHKMVDEKILVAETEIFGKRERRYYSLTNAGMSKATENVAEFRGYIETLNHLLEP